MTILRRTLFLCICLLSAGTAAAQTDPFDGSWKLNVARSTFTPGTAARNEIVTYEITGDTERFSADGYTASGARDQFFYTARYGGPEVPSKVIVTEERLAAMKVIDARTRDRFSKTDGKVVMRARRVVSDDGRVLTSTVYAVDAAGKETLRETRVFDRQGTRTVQGDPFHGTWTLNVGASTFNDPSTASTSETMTIKVSGDQETTHVEGVSARDAIVVHDYTVRHDGKDYPETVVTTNNSMTSLRKVNPRMRERLSKNDGRIVGISRRTVSPDGKTLTTALINVDANGKETVRQIRVFDKQ